jgi:hypothetical protein
MAQTIASPAQQSVDPSTDSAFLLFERLDCYRLAIEFQTIAATLLASRRVGSALRDQLDRRGRPGPQRIPSRCRARS